MCPDGYRFTSVNSPRIRTRPNVVSSVRFTAPEISETVYSGILETGAGRSSSIPLAYATGTPHGTTGESDESAGRRIGRTGARIVLGHRQQPAADQTLLRARQPGHRRDR